MIWKADELVEGYGEAQTEINGKWVSARPLNVRGFKQIIQELWLVLWGKVDVIIWPEEQ